MKSKYYLLLMAAAIISLFTACEKDSETKTITVTLGAQENTTVDGFYAVGENKTYTMAEASKDSLLTDLFCFYEASTGNNIALASPGSGITGIFTGDDAPANWKHQNTTYFYLTALNVAQFDAVQENDELIVTSFNSTDARRKAKDVQVDQVWSFKTTDNYYGLLKATAVVQGTNGTVTFVVKTKLVSLID
jgi:hypothetical protein